MAAGHPKEVVSGPDRGTELAITVGRDDRLQPTATGSTLRQPTAPGFPSSEGPCDRRDPCPAVAWSPDGFPRSHGPPEANVNDRSLTFSYPADGIRYEDDRCVRARLPADDRCVRPGPSADRRAGAPAAVVLTILQVSAASVPWFGGPCDPGTPCRPAARSADGVPGSHGPSEASVKAPSLTIRYRPGASPRDDRPQGRFCHDGDGDASCRGRADPASWPRARWSPRRCRWWPGAWAGPSRVMPGDRG